MKLTLFDIQRNSYVDGPGIRTAVFFKGCNMRCAWCHNPESQSFEKQILFYPNKCSGCGTCAKECPTGGIDDPAKCVFCGKCALYCPNDARKICGRDYTVPQIMELVLKDRAFYEKSGGGVTCSGGECMLQPDGLAELLRACKAESLHTAVDTAGNVPWESFEAVLPYADLFLYDIKAVTPQLHKQYTGADNSLIIENLKMLFSLGKSIWIRIPVIGGVNDSPEEMERVADFLSPFSPEKVELLPYHELGVGKYAALGRKPPRFYAPAQMERLTALFAV